MFAKKTPWEAYPVYVILTSASAFFSTTIFTINLVYQLQIAHLNPLQLVLVGTVLETSAFVTQVPTGALADIYSRRLAVILGVFLMGAGFILEGSIPQFWAILLAQVLWGIGATFVDGADRAWITDEVGEAQVGAVLLRAAQVSQISSLVAIPLSVALASIRLNLPILLGGLLFLALGALLLLVMPERGFHPTPREDRNSWQAIAATTISGLRLIRLRPILLTFLGIAALLGMFSEGFDRLWTAHLLADFRLPALGSLQPVVWFGVIRMGSALLNIGATQLLRRRLDTNNHRAVAWTLFAITAALMVSVLGFALTTSFALALLALWSAGLFRRVGEPVFSTWQVQHIDASVRATVLSISGQADALGQIAGGPAVGAIGNASLRAALVVAGAILAPSLLLFIRASRQGTPVAAPPEEVVLAAEP